MIEIVYLVSTGIEYEAPIVHGIALSLDDAFSMRDREDADYIEAYTLNSTEPPELTYNKNAPKMADAPRTPEELTADMAEIKKMEGEAVIYFEWRDKPTGNDLEP